MTDLDRLVKAIRKRRRPRPSRGRAWSRPAASKVIDCVLSLRRRYDCFVVPRLNAFEKAHPDIQTVRALHALIGAYPSPVSFMEQVLDYRDPARAQTLAGVTSYLVAVIDGHPGSSEDRTLARWASDAHPVGYRSVGVRGFGLAGYQYLRMLFGANTTKPDVHICRFVSKALKRRITARAALELLERAAFLAGVRLRDLDANIWEALARKDKRRSGKRSLTRNPGKVFTASGCESRRSSR